MSSEDGGGPSGSTFSIAGGAGRYSILSHDRGPETGDPLPTLGHAGPVARDPIRFGQHAPAGTDPDVALPAWHPRPNSPAPRRTGCLTASRPAGLPESGPAAPPRPPGPPEPPRLTGSAKASCTGQHGEDLRLLLLRRRGRLVRILGIQWTGGQNEHHQNRDGKSHLSFSNTLTFRPPTPSPRPHGGALS